MEVTEHIKISSQASKNLRDSSTDATDLQITNAFIELLVLLNFAPCNSVWPVLHVVKLAFFAKPVAPPKTEGHGPKIAFRSASDCVSF